MLIEPVAGFKVDCLFSFIAITLRVPEGQLHDTVVFFQSKVVFNLGFIFKLIFNAKICLGPIAMEQNK